MAVLRLLLAAGNQCVLHKQEFNTRSKERGNGFTRGIHDRLALYIEAGIQHHLSSSGFANGLQQCMEFGIIGR
jgi:hypothetical protein